MILSSLALLRDALNEFIVAKVPKYVDKPPAVLSDLVNQKGEFAVEATDRKNDDNILISLINLEEETIGKDQVYHVERPDGSREFLNPMLKLNLYVLFSAHSGKAVEERYKNSLELLSWVARFFQFKHVFTQANAPGMAPEIERLVVELMSPTFEEQNHLWGALGAKYLPSAVYKVRLLPLRELDESMVAPLITDVLTTARATT